MPKVSGLQALGCAVTGEQGEDSLFSPKLTPPAPSWPAGLSRLSMTTLPFFMGRAAHFVTHDCHFQLTDMYKESGDGIDARFQIHDWPYSLATFLQYFIGTKMGKHQKSFHIPP